MTPRERAERVFDRAHEGFDTLGVVPKHGWWVEAIAEAIEAAIQEEREACARVCDDEGREDFPKASENTDFYYGYAGSAQTCAAKIRERATQGDGT